MAEAKTEGAASGEATGTAGVAMAGTSDTEAAETASMAESEAVGIAGTIGMEATGMVAAGMSDADAAMTAGAAESEVAGTTGAMQMEGEACTEVACTTAATEVEEVHAIAVMDGWACNSDSLDAWVLHFFISVAKTWRKGSSLSGSESSLMQLEGT